MKTNVITYDEAIVRGNLNWGEDDNACEFHGIIPGYVVGSVLKQKKMELSMQVVVVLLMIMRKFLTLMRMSTGMIQVLVKICYV